MPDEVTNKAIEELAKQIPVREVYGDLASPATREIGVIAEDIIKTIHLALAPLQALGALQDRYRSFLERSVRRIPEDRRVTPAPQLLGPVLEAIRYEPEATPIDEMFSQLLSSGVDQEKIDNAHPAFVEIIKQLSSDEAILLASVIEGPRRWIFRSPLDSEKRQFGEPQTILDERPIGRLAKPRNFDLYMLHLFNLGLVAYYDWKAQEPEYEETQQRQVGDKIIPPGRVQIATKAYKELKLTPWGEVFMRACTGPA